MASNVVLTPTGRRTVEARGYPFAPSTVSALSTLAYTSNVRLVGGYSYSYAQIYRSQVWVRRAIDKYVWSFGQLPLKTYRLSADGERERVRGGRVDSRPSQLVRLLARPQPGKPGSYLRQFITGSLMTYGNYLGVPMNPRTLIAARSVGLPTELWSVPWWMVEVTEGKEQPIDWFTVRGADGQAFPYRPEEVVHIPFWSPDSPLGSSPLESLRQTLAIEDAAIRETRASFENGARPAGAFVVPERALSSDRADEIRRELEATYGGPDNAMKIAILNGNLEWKPMAFSHRELELIPTRKLTREEVAAAFQIDPTQLGILDRATFSNVTEAHRAWYMDSVNPVAVHIEEHLEAAFLGRYPEWADLDLEFDLAEVLKGDLPARAAAYQQFIQVGFTADEIRHFEGLPALGTPMSQQGFVQSALMPLAGAPPEQTGDETVMNALADAVVRRIAERSLTPPGASE